MVTSNNSSSTRKKLDDDSETNGNTEVDTDTDIEANYGVSKGSFQRMPSHKGSRFGGGLAGIVEASIASSIGKNLGCGNWTGPFSVTAKDLGDLTADPSRTALANLIYKAIVEQSSLSPKEAIDEEMPSPTKKLQHDVMQLVQQIRAEEDPDKFKELHRQGDHQALSIADKHADMAANLLTTVLLRSSPESGIDPREVAHRREVFGTNAITPKKLESFCKLCWDAAQDFVLVMLIVLGVIGIVVAVTTQPPGKPCTTCWIEGFAILASVFIVVMVTAGIDYAKQFAFLRLTRSLHDTNTKAVIRDGVQVSVTDDDIVVGDILSVNSHNLASIPADCVLLGPAGGAELHMDESTLTGESKPIRKRPGDIILSGTHATQGNGKLVVIAVGVNSVAGKIRARVYESQDIDSELEGEEGENSPLFVKLDTLAKRIGICGTVAASIAFLVSLIVGLGVKNEPARNIITYLVTAITVLAVAVPEGLPLAVTLALAFSSNKMMKEQNLVKHLDACETMGCATTICTDKTGTLTANKMTCRAMWTGDVNYLVEDPAESLGAYVRRLSCHSDLADLICRCIAIDTMNETVLHYAPNGSSVTGSSGNPTEVALLHLVHDLGRDYADIRNTTKGRSDQGQLGKYLSQGKQIEFSSARKIMSWAVPMENGTYRLYCKGAAEVVLARCSTYFGKNGQTLDLDAKVEDIKDVALAYARRGMRCLALACRDVPADFDWEATHHEITNSDGTPALVAETELSIISLVGIEDPLRHEVPGAIEKCYKAGIDVRMVTGDNPNTAVSIAYQAGILRDFHFIEGSTEFVASNLKENVLLEGKVFRSKVYREGEDSKKEFDQAAFDKIWPRLRVLARSSPDDKLTLAHGLNQSNLFADKAYCRQLLEKEGIKIFPDRQVVAMTGDGTNDAPALKRADIGFAMGVAGTQIAKDAADIILLDDNFASIVTAAKWGRNIYASIQKFLQFQLTVNIGAVITALVGAFTYQQSPLAAIQLLWVNLLMDSLASLALASEPPTEALLLRPPVNRTDSMITKHMIANMIGHAFYQVTVIMVLLFAGPKMFGIEQGTAYETATGKNSLHYTIIFNAFVMMTLFNEINARMLKGEFNVFRGIHRNPLFCSILLITMSLQVLIVQFGSIAFHVCEGGLPPKYWGITMALGLGSLPVQQVINIIYRISQHYNGIRLKKRRAKDGHLLAQHTDGAVSPRGIAYEITA